MNLFCARKSEVVTPSNTDDLPLTSARCIGLWVQDAGNVELMLEADSVAKVYTVEDGTLLPFYVKRVLAGNTTSTQIYALYY